MHSLYSVADIGNGTEVLKLYVEEMNDPAGSKTGKRAYNLQNIEKAFATRKRVQGKSPSSSANVPNAIRTVADLHVAVKVYDDNFTHKSASKIVNEDGTPKVMYHGTRAENGDFYVFDESKAVKKGGLGLKAMGKGNYFTAKKLNGSERYGSRVIAAYLDIKKPFVYKGGVSLMEQHHPCQECGNVPGQLVGGALYERSALNSQNDNLLLLFGQIFGDFPCKKFV
jgi:hypothetical protein